MFDLINWKKRQIEERTVKNYFFKTKLILSDLYKNKEYLNYYNNLFKESISLIWKKNKTILLSNWLKDYINWLLTFFKFDNKENVDYEWQIATKSYSLISNLSSIFYTDQINLNKYLQKLSNIYNEKFYYLEQIENNLFDLKLKDTLWNTIFNYSFSLLNNEKIYNSLKQLSNIAANWISEMNSTEVLKKQVINVFSWVNEMSLRSYELIDNVICKINKNTRIKNSQLKNFLLWLKKSYISINYLNNLYYLNNSNLNLTDNEIKNYLENICSNKWDNLTWLLMQNYLFNDKINNNKIISNFYSKYMLDLTTLIKKKNINYTWDINSLKKINSLLSWYLTFIKSQSKKWIDYNDIKIGVWKKLFNLNWFINTDKIKNTNS